MRQLMCQKEVKVKEEPKAISRFIVYEDELKSRCSSSWDHFWGFCTCSVWG